MNGGFFSESPGTSSPSEDMLIAGGICEFIAQPVPSRFREAQIAPALARASDGLLLLPIVRGAGCGIGARMARVGYPAVGEPTRPVPQPDEAS